ncbi:unnamed protein product [Symbiodinium natans]|uniref:Uncharacterized protein n=1 Tax=Symbiodinium natans TaxID=878477 RepID=A0A812R5U9_9DINO|nr:unnamed protein product [Symbiodinium natans]
MAGAYSRPRRSVQFKLAVAEGLELSKGQLIESCPAIVMARRPRSRPHYSEHRLFVCQDAGAAEAMLDAQ